MIDKLQQIEKTMMLDLLNQTHIWNSLFIDYHPPLVERLWTQVGTHRIYLHFLHQCEPKDALFHPHPWPSAIHVIEGAYEMGLGFGKGDGVPEKFCTILAPAGNFYYDMTHIDGWHYVRPTNIVCSSVMLAGPTWDRESPKSDQPLKPLSNERKAVMIEYFRQYYLKVNAETIKVDNSQEINKGDWIEFNKSLMDSSELLEYSEFMGQKGFVIRHSYAAGIMSIRFGSERVDEIPSHLVKKII